ncbi:MAG: hypothetical protein ACO2PN_29305 [Pyrobaculum sp.]
MEAELQRFIPQIYKNYSVDTVPDVKAAIYRAIVTLFMRQCRNVDPQLECVAVPANPKTDFGAGGRYVDVVQTNAYQSDDWVASVNPGITDILAVRLKPDTAAIAIAGFAVETDETLKSRIPVVRINIYQDLTKQKPVRTLNMLLSTAPMDHPLAYAMFPEPIIVGPGKELVIEVVADARLTSPQQYVVMWLPPIVLTSRRRVGYV